MSGGHQVSSMRQASVPLPEQTTTRTVATDTDANTNAGTNAPAPARTTYDQLQPESRQTTDVPRRHQVPPVWQAGVPVPF